MEVCSVKMSFRACLEAIFRLNTRELVGARKKKSTRLVGHFHLVFHPGPAYYKQKQLQGRGGPEPNLAGRGKRETVGFVARSGVGSATRDDVGG